MVLKRRESIDLTPLKLPGLLDDLTPRPYRDSWLHETLILQLKTNILLPCETIAASFGLGYIAAATIFDEPGRATVYLNMAFDGTSRSNLDLFADQISN